MLLKILLTPLSPAQSQFHRRLRPRTIRGILRALIERHNNVGAQADLRCHGALWCEEVRRAIEMRAERNSLFGYLAKLVQAENLEASGVGEDRTRPRHETMQPAELADSFDSGTQIKVISVAEKNLHAKFFEDILRHPFHRGHGADRHEHRGFNYSMRSEQSPGARTFTRSINAKFNGHSFVIGIVATRRGVTIA